MSFFKNPTLISFHGRKYLAGQGKHGDGKILFDVLSVLQPQSTSP